MLTFIVGESELAKRIRAHPWEKTALGPAGTWPDSLKTLVSVMLAANQPMYTVWGPSQILLYNDQYISVLQGHHPDALGQPFLQVWSEIVDDLRPLVEKAYAGIPSYTDEITLMVERNGYVEETHFAYSYTPVFNRDGGVDGFFCPCIETTEQVKAARVISQSEERQAFLLRLADALRPLTDPVETQRVAMRLLGEQLQVMRASYFEVDPDQDTFTVAARHERNPVPIPDRMRLSDFAPEMTAAYRAGRTLVFRDTETDTQLGSDPASYRPIGIRAWAAAPLVKDGNLLAIVGVHSTTPRNWTAGEISLIEDVAERTWAAVERARAEAALRESEERFQQFANASASALWIRDAKTLAMEYVSPAIAKVYGIEPEAVLGNVERWAALILPEDRDIALEHVAEASSGQSVVHEFRIQRQSDRAFRWIRDTGFPLRDNGSISRLGGIAEDVTEAKVAVAHQAVLLAELQHRVRNIMAIIRSMANRSAAGASSIEHYRSSLEGRLMALARVQVLLTRQANAGGSLRDIIESEISAQAYHPGQYDLTGPDIMLSPKVVEVLTLAFHELSTNALKYGGLSVPGGRVTVEWGTFEKRGAPWLSLDWVEAGAPHRDPTTRRGFGSELIEMKIPYELRGTGKIAIEAGQARCHLEIPLRNAESILETDAPTPITIHGGSLDMTGAPDLNDASVLIVEDDYYMASDVASALRGAGAEIIGPCPTEEATHAILDTETPTSAILDLNLGGGGPRFEIARLLRTKGVPFVFLTGYDADVVPEDMQHIVRIQKPVAMREIIDAISRLGQDATG